MLPPVFQTLQASAAVTALVSDRVFGAQEAPQGVAKPYLTWFCVSAAPENNLSNTPPVDRVTVQIDVFSLTESQAWTLAEAVRDAIEPYAHMVGMPVHERDAETRAFHFALEFDWWLSR